jgi:hypothetical protein
MKRALKKVHKKKLERQLNPQTPLPPLDEHSLLVHIWTEINFFKKRL